MVVVRYKREVMCVYFWIYVSFKNWVFGFMKIRDFLKFWYNFKMLLLRSIVDLNNLIR